MVLCFSCIHMLAFALILRCSRPDEGRGLFHCLAFCFAEGDEILHDHRHL